MHPLPLMIFRYSPILALIFWSGFTSSQIDSTNQKNQLNALIDRANYSVHRTIPEACQNQEIDVPTPTAKAHDLVVKTDIIEDHLGRRLPVSVIDEDSLFALTDLYPTRLKTFNPRVCSARAHLIGAALARHGIETQKIFLRPKIGILKSYFIIPDDRLRTNDGRTPHWDYHVANVIHVRQKNDEIKEYIIDPLMESLPVPREKWEERLRKNPKSSIETIKYISRFNLGDDINEHQTEYEPGELEKASIIMLNAN